MIRPSSLQLAEKCSHFIELQEKFPETSENAERGNVVDKQNTEELLNLAEAKDPDAMACLQQLANIRDCMGPLKQFVQSKVELLDPDTGNLLTEGTPDVQLYSPPHVMTIDWKKQEQFFSGYVSPPDDNLQLHAYSLARALNEGASTYQNVLIIFGDGEADTLFSSIFQTYESADIINRIRNIQSKPTTASPGTHCSNCWQRWVCGSYRERAKLALTLIEDDALLTPDDHGGPAMSDERAALLVERAESVKAAATLALDIAKAHHRGGGVIAKDGKRYVPVMCKGRQSGNLELLRKDGLTKYIKEGAQYERWGWRKVK